LWLWLAIPLGSLALSVGYFFFAESTASSNSPGGDISMGMGAFFLSVPIFLTVLIIIWVGAGIGRLVAGKRKRIS
jgi:ABC-type dipeptide/oligopeptide/nickel transport system permease component